MTRNFTFFLLSFTLLLTSCEKNEGLNNDVTDVSNLSGESFKKLTNENNVELIIRVETQLGTSDFEYIRNKYSFPGNNFITIWNEFEPSNSRFSEKSYNLEKIIWYKIEDFEYQNGDVRKALYIEFEPY